MKSRSEFLNDEEYIAYLRFYYLGQMLRGVNIRLMDETIMQYFPKYIVTIIDNCIKEIKKTDGDVFSDILIPVTKMNLSVRARNVLRVMGIEFINDFQKKDITAKELIMQRNCGRSTLLEIQNSLLHWGIILQ